MPDSVLIENHNMSVHGWFEQLLGQPLPAPGDVVTLNGATFICEDGILRSMQVASANQRQTSDAFGFKWHRRESYESPAVLAAVRTWLIERYGPPDAMSWLFASDSPQVLLDAGCGSALSALELFGPRL